MTPIEKLLYTAYRKNAYDGRPGGCLPEQPTAASGVTLAGMVGLSII